MRASAMLMVLLALPTPALATPAPRFSGAGTLVQGAAESADRRFRLEAELQAGDDQQQGGRFSLDARLAVSDAAKTANTACIAEPDIFRNGFE